MMSALFVASLAALLSCVLVWAPRHLPREHWQVLASLPRRRSGDTWTATNLTWYGALTAMAGMVASALFLVLATASGATIVEAALVTLCGLGIAVPCSSFIATRVEKKPHTLSIAGAMIPTFLLLPIGIHVYAESELAAASALQPMAMVAALMVAYVIGEGLGRIACLSFGCCYGAPVSDVRPSLRRVFSRWNIVFHGPMKKAAYAGSLDGVPLVPIQTMTSWVHTVGGCLAVWLFLRGDVVNAFGVAAATALGWRFASEFLRHDHRGAIRVSPYQWASLVGLGYAALLVAALRAPAPAVDLLGGLRAVWAPGPILALQLIGVGLFLHSGVSKVTGCEARLHLHADRV